MQITFQDMLHYDVMGLTPSNTYNTIYIFKTTSSVRFHIEHSNHKITWHHSTTRVSYRILGWGGIKCVRKHVTCASLYKKQGLGVLHQNLNLHTTVSINMVNLFIHCTISIVYNYIILNFKILGGGCLKGWGCWGGGEPGDLLRRFGRQACLT